MVGVHFHQELERRVLGHCSEQIAQKFQRHPRRLRVRPQRHERNTTGTFLQFGVKRRPKKGVDGFGGGGGRCGRRMVSGFSGGGSRRVQIALLFGVVDQPDWAQGNNVGLHRARKVEELVGVHEAELRLPGLALEVREFRAEKTIL
jgi:hypothetical protein